MRQVRGGTRQEGQEGAESGPEVAFLMPTYSDGGAERVMVDLANGLANRGYTVDLVVVNESGPIVYEFAEGVSVFSLDRSRVGFALVSLLTYLRHRRPPALLSTLEHTNILAVLAGRFTGRTKVVVREANTSTEALGHVGIKGRIIGLLMRIAYRAADGVVAVSEGVARAMEEGLGLNPTSVTVIANPVITERLRAGAREPADHPWFHDAGEPVVLAVGRLTEQKAFDVLIRAFAKARTTVPCRLVIFGEGPLRSELLALAESLGVSGYMALPGFTPNPFSHMAACKLFVLSSRWEGLPNVLIQALACGARVVSTDCPSGPREVLAGGAFGALVPVDDVGSLANAIRRGLSLAPPDLPPSWFDSYEPDAILDSYSSVLGLAPVSTGTNCSSSRR